MKRMLMVLILAVCVAAARAAELTVTWDCPTTNTDGSALVDLVAFDLQARRCDTVQVAWTTATWRAFGQTVTQRVVGAVTWIPGPTQAVVRVPAVTNAPVGLVTQSAALTNLTLNRVYELRGSAVNSVGAESADSDPFISATGTPVPSAVKLRF